MNLIKNEKDFLQLYDEYVEKIYRYIFFRVGSEELARDLASEVFLRSWQYINQTRSSKLGIFNSKNQKIENPRAFLYQVARNLIVDNYRQKEILPISLEEIADTQIADKIADKKNDPRELADKSLEIEIVKNALTKLNEDYQEIIIWRYLDDLEIKEIAEILGKTENAVRVLLFRALADLKAVLKKL